MRASPSMSIYDHWSQPSYEVRVRPTALLRPPKFLWGSAGVEQNMTFDKPLLLHIRNDVLGEAITFGTQVFSGVTQTQTRTIIGTLLPGECVSIPLQGYSGVFATCEVESVVACLIKGSS
jgi:hypothetical protein